MEFSEARYAEIARKLLLEPNWITLWYTDLMPFWGKPPRSSWAVATSFELFGICELSARLPSLIATVATAVLVFHLIRRILDEELAVSAAIVFLTLVLVIQAGGTVITDPLLTFLTTTIMVGFWLAVTQGQRYWGDAMWIALGLGLLTKGPIALVLPALACGLWVALQGQWRRFFRAFHWVSGPILMLLVGVPWYLFAEQATSGFLEYFLVGEHFSRFLEPAWEGDPYGAVKDMPLGSIWVYLVVASAPWSLILVLAFVVPSWRAKTLGTLRATNRSWLVFLVCWTLVPVAFFTPARNVLVTYVMPGMPALAILTAIALQHILNLRALATTAVVIVALFGIGSVLSYQLYFDGHKYNQRPIIREYQRLAASDPGPLVYTGGLRFSAMFYTANEILFSRHISRIHQDRTGTLYYAVRDRWYESLRAFFGASCDEMIRRNDVSLWYCPAARIP